MSAPIVLMNGRSRRALFRRQPGKIKSLLLKVRYLKEPDSDGVV